MAWLFLLTSAFNVTLLLFISFCIIDDIVVLYEVLLMKFLLIFLVLIFAASCLAETPVSTVADFPPVVLSLDLSVSNSTMNSIELFWASALDDWTSGNLLEYKIIRSFGTNYIRNIAEADDNGIIVQDWQRGIDSVVINGLDAKETNNFNVLVRDASGNTAFYDMLNLEEIDFESPVPGRDGFIFLSNIRPDSVMVSWMKATDNISDETNLEYSIFTSDTTNINEATHSILLGKNVTTFQINNALFLKNYIILQVKDEIGKTALYRVKRIPRIFVTDKVNGRIYSANIVGNTSLNEIVSFRDAPKRIKVHSVERKIYWTEGDGGVGRICRADLDGANIEIVISNLASPYALGIDHINNRVYWSDISLSNIQRADLDGANQSVVISGDGVGAVRGMALDLTNSQIYFVNVQGNYKISSCGLSDGGTILLVSPDAEGPYDISLDIGSGRFYWADFYLNSVKSANFSGPFDVQHIINGSISLARGLAVTVQYNAIYTVHSGGIWQSRMDGSDGIVFNNYSNLNGIILFLD